MADRDLRVDPTTTRPAEAGRRPFAFSSTNRRIERFLIRAERARFWLGDNFEREIDAGRGFAWLPVLFGGGVLIYFALPREPSAMALLAASMLLLLATVRWRQRITAFRFLLALTMLVTGATAAKLRTDFVAAPALEREMTVDVSGWVAEREAASRGGVRIRLLVDRIAGLDPDRAPRVVQITVRSTAGTIAVGDAIAMVARLQPPSGPVLPGGFDFAEAAFYTGIGAVGFAYGAAHPADIGPAPLPIRLMRPLAEIRRAIRERIITALPGDNGEFAAALVMGDQGGIARSTHDAMRASGLGHVLSISGLHMALVAGSAFWLIRALLALSTTLALNRPIKKWAAGGALLVAFLYLGISGGGVATVRSFIMMAVMLVAILIDRRALTLRNVALSALIILVVEPESIVSASFQMSFAATLALVAMFEAASARVAKEPSITTNSHGVIARLRRSIGGLVLTSLIAGLATAPFAIYHFQRAAPLSLLANLAAMPVVGIAVMPMAFLAVVLMPFGLESLPLAVMAYGLDWMRLVAETTARWSEGWGSMPMAPAGALLLVVAGLLWMSLWRERWRFAGIVPMLLAIPLAVTAPRPDILVAENGEALAVRGADGRYQIIGARGHRFETEIWLRSTGDPRSPTDASITAGVKCDPKGCVAALGNNVGLVATTYRPAAFKDDCTLAAVVVTRLKAPRSCADTATVVDRTVLAAGGAEALFLLPTEGAENGSRPRFRIEPAYPDVRRPFMRQIPASPVNSGGGARSAVPGS